MKGEFVKNLVARIRASLWKPLLHKALNQHLNGIGKFVEGEWVTMWARKGNPTKAVVEAFNPAERLNKLDRFYKYYAQGIFHQNFKDEVITTLARGDFK